MAKVINLFIDTNIILSFYHLTNEDIEELHKLVTAIRHKDIKLILPSHVKDEYSRNRDVKINDALKKLNEVKFNINFPAFCKDYPEYVELCAMIKDLNKKHSELAARIMQDLEAQNLNADSIIGALFQKATIVAVTDEIYAAALKRVELGNPPGKRGSLGDAINWESMLSAVEEKQAIYIVSADKDYRSPLSEDKLNSFLIQEWEEKKQSQIYFYSRISDFFKEQYPGIKLATELEKDIPIRNLAKSSSFSETHICIAKLRNHADFTIPQVEQLISIPEANSQVGWIIYDSDLQDFYKNLYGNYSSKLDETSRQKLQDLLVDDNEYESNKKSDLDVDEEVIL